MFELGRILLQLGHPFLSDPHGRQLIVSERAVARMTCRATAIVRT
jgi:hypothetical protein